MACTGSQDAMDVDSSGEEDYVTITIRTEPVTKEAAVVEDDLEEKGLSLE